MPVATRVKVRFKAVNPHKTLARKLGSYSVEWMERQGDFWVGEIRVAAEYARWVDNEMGV